MREQSPFTASDLEELDARLLSRAARVVPMHDVARGDMAANVIGLRHDVDDNAGSFDTALRLAEWEFEHGYSSTYFLLHDSCYWEERIHEAERFEDLGHEVGLHVNAIAEGFRQLRDPHEILSEALSELRSVGVRVHGSVAHGDPICHRARFVNDELFTESARPRYGKHDRTLVYNGNSYKIVPVSRKAYQLEYDASWLKRGDYLSDSGGAWSQPFLTTCGDWPGRGQLHVLVHPDWWSEAFVGVAA